MQTFLVIDNTEYPATFFGNTRDYNWNEREVKTIHIEMTYADAIDLFVDNLSWKIKAVMEPAEEGKEPIIEYYDNSDYKLSGPILDNRDGTLDVKMGKLTTLEQFIEDIYGGVNNVR